MKFILINVKTVTIPGGEVSFSENQNQLKGPKIMIVDTVANCYLAAWHEFMINLKTACAEYTLTEANIE